MKNSKGVAALFILMGLLYLASLIGFNPWVIQLITGEFHSYYVNNIHQLQLYIAVTGIFMLCVGILGYRTPLLNFTNHSKLASNITASVLVLFSGLVFIEFLLHVKPEMTTAELFDASIPYENATFARTRFPQEKTDVPHKYLTHKINYHLTQGYHGTEFPFEKPAGEVRIVILGGSFIFGDHHATYWKEIEAEYNRNWILRTERKMHATGLEHVRLINAGIPGHASFDSFGRLYSEIHLFNPDIVVFCQGWNDIKYFSTISPENSLLRQINPGTRKSREDVYDFLEYSQIYLKIKRIFQFKNVGVEGMKSEGQGVAHISPYAKKQFELNLNLFVHACKLIGAQPVLLTQPRLVSESNTSAEREKIEYDFQKLDHDGICEAYNFIDSVVMAYALKDSTVISHDFARPFVGVDSLYADHLHLNAVGSEVLSSYLATYLAGIVQER